MAFEEVMGEYLRESEKNLFGNGRERDPCYVVAKAVVA